MGNKDQLLQSMRLLDSALDAYNLYVRHLSHVERDLEGLLIELDRPSLVVGSIERDLACVRQMLVHARSIPTLVRRP